jgi:probable DNA repair protein
LLELPPQLEAALSAAQTVVVPTAQRAAALRLAVASRHLAAGRRAFRTPDVRSFGGWLRGQPALLRRLGAGEEWLLWRAAVASATARLSLPNIAGLVEALRSSAGLLGEWRIPPGALLQSGTPEAALLAEVLALMDTRLGELSAVASWHALEELADAPPRRVPRFAGFAYVTPAQRALLSAWGGRGGAAPEPDCSFAPAPTAVARASDPQQELAMSAQWCRERLTAQPDARLLVIVPDLAQRHTQVRRLFDAALDPAYLARGAADVEAAPYALEGGQSLLGYAPVAEGLQTLQLLSSDVELAAVSQWLRGSFWARPTAGVRAQLDVWLRTVVPPRLNARQLLQALRAAPPALLAHADELSAALEQMLDALRGETRAALSVWSGRFAQVLARCGLDPKTARQRSSHTQQVLQRLDELLQECGACSSALGVFDKTEALAVFTQLLARTQFEPATGDAAVTLTAALDDPIVRYDGIWVSGLHAGAIPERARFDPFIPAELQRRAGMIAADAAALVTQARQALSRLRCCSRETIFSWPAHAEDLERVVSPLLAPYAAHTSAPRSAGHELSRVIRESRQIESYAHEPGLTWEPTVPLPAGTRAIELQSRCPFRAYAQLRLGAEPIEAPAPGIAPRERGRLLHRALELLWQRLGGSVGLAAARAAQSLSPTIAESVSQAATEILSRHPGDAAADATGLLELRQAAIVREQGRAARLIAALCQLESARAPFVIAELEAAHRVQIGGARVDVRVDRLDRLADGSHAILDYKSGRALTPDWDVERTTHPQLLVYLLAVGVPVSTLAVAHLDPKAVVFKGIGDQDGRLPDVPGSAEWPRQLAAWRQQVRQLAEDFLRGEARVDPSEKACDYCHLHAFCRIADAAAPA